MNTQRNPILEKAWRQFAAFDANSANHQKLFKRLQLGILALGVAAVLLALTQAQIFGVEPDGATQASWGYLLLRYAIILAPILLSILISASHRFKSGTKWIMLRAAAESLKREIVRYRARSGIYSDGATSETSRDLKLAEKMSLITRQLMKSAVSESSVTPYGEDQPIPPKMYGAAGGDDGFSRLTPENYIEFRLRDQLAFYSGKTRTLEKKLKVLHWLIYLIGGLGTLLAAIGFELWVALTTSIAAAFATYLEYTQTENTLVLYNQMSTNLDNTLTWWAALTPAQQADPEKQGLLVEQTEQALADEHAGWVQQMTDALADLQEQQKAATETVKARIEQVREEAAEQQARLEAARLQDELEEPEPEPEAEAESEPEPALEAKKETVEEKKAEEVQPLSAPAPRAAPKKLQEEDLIGVARDLGIELAAMKAVAEVEAGGSGFKGGRPKILFEGHVFWRRLAARGIDPQRLVAGNENILHRKWSRNFYREDQYSRLEKAKQIDEAAGLESASWGMFQIMGYHWENLGYGSAQEFVERMFEGEGEHLRAFARFLEANNLVRHLKSLNWASFARGYNGPGYAENRYDTKMAQAYAKHKA